MLYQCDGGRALRLNRPQGKGSLTRKKETNARSVGRSKERVIAWKWELKSRGAGEAGGTASGATCGFGSAGTGSLWSPWSSLS
ncbi:hypothetical protein KL86CLO1_11006 [uncultured Eubacteriales bacterium]|uniref:Uncharacterized protein n=1 Tax=uncultured Eubacteriales bacterium TaxID=172733 RepID=A0A212JFF3_9FIRM|nr:hypothetical protein KL86CLO1_11006 [uncultured Eubacteriales bacterium]